MYHESYAGKFMAHTTSKPGQDAYKIPDPVTETGERAENMRKGRIVTKPADALAVSSRLAQLEKRDCILGNPEDLVEIDWSQGWAADV